MKKTYQKPEIYTEDVSIAFAQNCCSATETPTGVNQFAGFVCAMCTIETIYEYLKC